MDTFIYILAYLFGAVVILLLLFGCVVSFYVALIGIIKGDIRADGRYDD